MADAIRHDLTFVNTHLRNSAGAGRPLPIARFRDKSLQLHIEGAGSYTVEVSNDKANWIAIATALTVGEHLITNEEGAANRFPHKASWMRIVTVTHEGATIATFLGEDD